MEFDTTFPITKADAHGRVYTLYELDVRAILEGDSNDWFISAIQVPGTPIGETKDVWFDLEEIDPLYGQIEDFLCRACRDEMEEVYADWLSEYDSDAYSDKYSDDEHRTY